MPNTREFMFGALGLLFLAATSLLCWLMVSIPTP
jgi:hypothetical protein